MRKLESNTNSKNYNVQIAVGPARLEGETLADYIIRMSAKNVARGPMTPEETRPARKVNRGTFRRGYNRLVTCRCCKHKTQSQIGSGCDLCQECFDFSSDYNTWQDGGCKAIELPQPVRCPNCKADRDEAIQRDAAKAV
jgi:hypothetical protein